MNSIITDTVKRDICARAAQVASEDEVADTIFAGLSQACIDWREVDLEETKALLVQAIRSFRRNHEHALLRLAS